MSQSGQSASVTLRDNQLTSALFDAEIRSLLAAQLTRAFGLTATSWKRELDLLLNGALWYLSVWSSGHTVGQQLQNVSYHNTWHASSKAPAARWQRVALGLATVVAPYAWQRWTQTQEDRRWINRIEAAWQTLTLLNLVAFFWTGRYPLLFERLLGLLLVHVSPTLTRSVAFDYLNRQLVWQGFTEFLLFIMPLVDFDKIQNWRHRLVPANPSAAPTQCGVCHADPMHNPHVLDCGHGCCYFCIATKLQEDSSFPCPRCGASTTGLVRVVDRADCIEEIQ